MWSYERTMVRNRGSTESLNGSTISTDSFIELHGMQSATSLGLGVLAASTVDSITTGFFGAFGLL